jgi:methylthioribulose-1-phosphate dehydratase
MKQLLCDLAKQMYDLGWASGTGGGISIREQNLIHMAPSGVQKERMQPEDIFTLNIHGQVLDGTAGGKVSECKPLFMHAYNHRHAGAVLHSHSINALLATQCYSDKFQIRNLEMQKGISGHGAFDLLEVPIIENTAKEAQLSDSLEQAIIDNPKTQAVLVRGHGVYVWGNTWQQAKTHAECYDFLFKAAVEIQKIGKDPLAIRAYRLDDKIPLSRADLLAEEIQTRFMHPANYQESLTHIKQMQGYESQDSVIMSPETPGLDDIKQKFSAEHSHTDDEVRYISSGRGIFDIRSKNDTWIRIEVGAGDFLNIPRNRYHRFFLGEENNISAVRLFKDETGWVPKYRE